MLPAMSSQSVTIDLPKNPAARRAWLSYQLKLRGSSVAQLARSAGVSREALYGAMNSASSHLERTIARALDATPQQLFPERFDRDGRRLSRTRAPNRSTPKQPVTVEKAGAF
jgi:lambda repressor-like predicted transcriptional regulator